LWNRTNDAWLRKLDEECPYQVVLPRKQLTNDSEILDFLLAHVGWFDVYVEDDYAAFVAIASKTRWMRKFSALASSRRSSTSSSPGDRPGGSLLRREDRYWVISAIISGTANEAAVSRVLAGSPCRLRISVKRFA
jgi:hypothetical protein